MNVSREMILQARQIDLAKFLSFKGENIVRVGNNEYSLKEHDSIRIRENVFKWFSRDISGNSIDFLMVYYNVGLVDAVNMLLGSNVPIVQNVSRKYVIEKKYTFVSSANNKRVIAYLCQSRKLDYNIIKPFLFDGSIAQDKNNNVVFFSPSGGAEVSTTLSDRKWKRIFGNYDGFRVVVGVPLLALIFESAIDLLSYYQLKKDKINNALLISMGGLKKSFIDIVVHQFNIDISNIYLCVDNFREDEPARNFILNCLNSYPRIKYVVCPYHDWNDLLKIEQVN